MLYVFQLQQTGISLAFTGAGLALRRSLTGFPEMTQVTVVIGTQAGGLTTGHSTPVRTNSGREFWLLDHLFTCYFIYLYLEIYKKKYMRYHIFVHCCLVLV